MSTEHNDQHLSDAVDGQLPAESLLALRRDAQLSSRLQSMRQDAAALRTIGEQTRRQIEQPHASGQRPSIAAAVLAEAIRRAEQQQLDAAHPVMLASESIGTEPVRRPGRRMSTIQWSAVAALAASVAVWFTLAPPPTPEVALTPHPLIQPAGTALDDSSNATVSAASSATDDPPVDSQIASADFAPKAGVDSIALATPDIEPANTTPIEAVDSAVVPPTESMASAAVPVNPTDRSFAAPDSPSGFTPFLLVYEVRLTPMGRALRPVRTAMIEAGLTDANRFAIDESTVNVARSVVEPGAAFRVMLLRASSKALGDLANRLALDDESVESVGMTLISNASVARMVQSVSDQVVSAKGMGVELTDQQDETPAKLAGWMSQRPFAPLGGESALTSSGAIYGKESTIANVLVLIR